MGYKRYVRKFAMFVLAEQPKKFVTVKIDNVTTGSILKGKKIVVAGGAQV